MPDLYILGRSKPQDRPADMRDIWAWRLILLACFLAFVGLAALANSVYGWVVALLKAVLKEVR